MLLKQMRYFVTIVRCHSFTEAAEECFISQSAISQQMKSLEEEIGTPLFIRERRSFSLTKAGEHFYRHCLGVLDEVDRIMFETKQIGEYDDEHLSIAFVDGFYNREVRQAISQFSQLYPEVQIEVASGSHEDIYHLLQSGEVDCGLNDQRRAFSDNYVNYHLTNIPCYIEIAKSNPLAQLEQLSIEDLRRLPCILIASSEQEETERTFYKEILGFGNEYTFVRNQETARIMVAANKGFRLVTGKHHERETITYRPLCESNQLVTRHYCLFWKKEKNGYYIEELADILYRCFHQEESSS